MAEVPEKCQGVLIDSDTLDLVPCSNAPTEIVGEENLCARCAGHRRDVFKQAEAIPDAIEEDE